MRMTDGISSGMTELEGDQEAERALSPRACTISMFTAALAVENELGKPPQRKSWSHSTGKTRKIATRNAVQCSVDGCNRQRRSGGRCKAHGGGRRCLVEGCPRSDQGGGFCIRHGGGERCAVDGCKNSAQRRGRCKAHGGSSYDSARKRIQREMMADGGQPTTGKSPQRERIPADVSTPVRVKEDKQCRASVKTYKILKDATTCKSIDGARVLNGHEDGKLRELDWGSTLCEIRGAGGTARGLDTYSCATQSSDESAMSTRSATQQQRSVPASFVVRPDRVVKNKPDVRCGIPMRWPRHGSSGNSQGDGISQSASKAFEDEHSLSSVSVAELLLSLQRQVSLEQ